MKKPVVLAVQGDEQEYKTHNCMVEYAELCITLGHDVGVISLPDLLKSSERSIKSLMQNVSNLKRQLDRSNRVKK